jgi:hypothetical protein
MFFREAGYVLHLPTDEENIYVEEPYELAVYSN